MQRLRWMLRNTLGRDVTVAMIVKLLLLGTVLLIAGRAVRSVNDATTTAAHIVGDAAEVEVRR